MSGSCRGRWPSSQPPCWLASPGWLCRARPAAACGPPNPRPPSPRQTWDLPRPPYRGPEKNRQIISYCVVFLVTEKNICLVRIVCCKKMDEMYVIFRKYFPKCYMVIPVIVKRKSKKMKKEWDRKGHRTGVSHVFVYTKKLVIWNKLKVTLFYIHVYSLNEAIISWAKKW